MISKILIVSGTIIIFASVAGIGGGIYSSFRAMEVNESAGIGVVGSGILFALASNILVFVGLAILVVGIVKFFREKSPRK